MAKTNVVLIKNSRYVQGGVTERTSDRVGWWERRSFPKSDSDLFITIDSQTHLRPDIVANKFLGQANLMWLVLQYNNIVDINTEFVTGKELRLPTQSRVAIQLLNKTPGGKFV